MAPPSPTPIAPPAWPPFDRQLTTPLSKRRITTLQINLGKKCNLACTHCHVEASPRRSEELIPEVCDALITMIDRFPQIETVDLTGGAPEMNYGFRPLVEAARSHGKTVIVRSNLTIFEIDGYSDLPDYFAQHQLRVVASLPCYLADNVDKMRGVGVFDSSIRGLQRLNALGYATTNPALVLDLVYNPPLPIAPEKFALPPAQAHLETAYQNYLEREFGVQFNHLLTIANLPIGRTQQFLQRHNLDRAYTQFLAEHFNPATVDGLMCRNQLSIDYLGQVFDCDFNQMENLPARDRQGQRLTVARLLELDTLDAIGCVGTADFCYGCTAGAGSSCGGALV